MNRRSLRMQFVAAALFAAGRLPTLAADAASSDPQRGYIGVDVVERGEGLMVWRVMPGPLDGGFVVSGSLARGDLVVTIDGAAATLAAWNAIAERALGSEIRIGYREGKVRGVNGAPDPAGALREVAVTVDDAALWRGWHRSGELPPLTMPPCAHDELARDAARAYAELAPAARSRADALVKSLDGIAAQHGDPATPVLLRAALREPMRAEGFVRTAVGAAEGFRASPFRAAATLVTRLAGEATAPLPEPHGVFRIEHAEAGVWYLDFLLNGARSKFDELVARESAVLPGLRPLVVQRLDDLLVRGPNAREAMLALRAIPTLPAVKAATILAHFDVVEEIAPGVASGEAAELPAALAGAVDGSIIAASEIAELGWVVVGGTGPNRYDLGRVAAVLDLGGDDRYAWLHGGGQHRLVVDLAGNDQHTGGPVLGPAGSLGGIAVIDDRSGNDRYEGGALTAGTALGVVALVDRAGDDVYAAGAWSLGAAAGGAAVVVDLSGADRIDAEGMAIGVGGPSAVGAFVDVAGDDVAALGTRPSVYGVAGEHAGFGMGLGLGFRLAAAGGVGAYIDFEGRDQRRSGEFSQGCGYYLGLGILLDGAGDDVSTCDRYGIGSAAHQAAGVAIDLGGHDSYAARTAAHLGAAWDESLGVFHDAAGDDSYRVDGLSIGAAAQQAFGLAIDRAGRDQYRALGGVVLGASSDNEYHFDATGLGSVALFLDLEGLDLYPAARSNDAVRASAESATPRLKEQDSVFLDERSAATPPAR